MFSCTTKRGRLGVSPWTGAVLAAVVALGACSWVPDEADPTTWFESDDTVDDGAEFPNLASVPEAPQEATTTDEFATVAEGLAADRDNASYTDDTIRRADDEVDGDLALIEPAQPTVSAVEEPEPEPEPIEDTTTISEVQPPPAEPAPEPEPVVAEAAPTPSQTLANTTATTVAVTQAVPAEPLPGADVTSLFNAAYAASGAKVLPTQGQTQAQPVAVAASTANSAVFTSPTRLVGSIGFAEGSARLGDRARADLLEIAYAYGASGGPLRIVGHASPSGSADATKRKIANLDIALDRALAVARELERLGVPADRMNIEAQPEAEFAVATDGGGRRVDVFLGP